MENSIKAGDVVRLKSDINFFTTISEVLGNSMAECHYVLNGTIEQIRLPLIILEKV